MDCQICGGLLKLLGILGAKAHFRCVDCGIDFNLTLETDKWGEPIVPWEDGRCREEYDIYDDCEEEDE